MKLEAEECKEGSREMHAIRKGPIMRFFMRLCWSRKVERHSTLHDCSSSANAFLHSQRLLRTVDGRGMHAALAACAVLIEYTADLLTG